MNTAYAFLAGEADAADRISAPTMLAAGADPDDVDSSLRRDALDEWLSAPMGREAASEQALLSYLKGA